MFVGLKSEIEANQLTFHITRTLKYKAAREEEDLLTVNVFLHGFTKYRKKKEKTHFYRTLIFCFLR